MSNTGAPMIELPRYKSHKVVRALSIAAIEIHEDKSATIAPSLAGYAPFRTRPGWADKFKGSEEDKGYYVVYEDNYASWSPTEAFENGYTRLRDDSGFMTQCDTLLTQLQAVIDSPRKRTHEQMKAVAERLKAMSDIALFMELGEVQP